MTTSTEMIGRYELLAEIGRSDVGVVYQGHDPENDRVVAVKAVPLSELPNSNPLQFFLEARASKRLSHPGIVCLYDVGICPEKQMLYMVREYVAGITLEAMLQNGELAPETSLRIAQELAEALDYAHREGLVHGNIQPYNILITEEGHAKVSEFSAAKLDRAVRGDTPFAPPEQLSGSEPDTRSDLFSLGAVLYTMLTGHVPFRARGAKTVNWSSHRRAVSMANGGGLAVGPDVDVLLQKALQTKPEDRFQLARQMAFALQKAVTPIPEEPKIDQAVLESVETLIDEPDTEEEAIAAVPHSFLQSNRIWVFASAAGFFLAALVLAILVAGGDPATPANKSHTPHAAKQSGASKPSPVLNRATRSNKSAAPAPAKRPDGTPQSKSGLVDEASSAQPSL